MSAIIQAVNLIQKIGHVCQLQKIKVNPKSSVNTPPSYPLGLCIDAWLSANLSASLYLDAFLDAVKVSFVTVPLILFLGFVLV